ncbi:hypothetical protein [Deinococcus hopiensis]|nr:hypothetical protein [Deinococcus hopiensis]
MSLRLFGLLARDHGLQVTVGDRYTPPQAYDAVISIGSVGEDVPVWVRLMAHQQGPTRVLRLEFSDVHFAAHRYAAQEEHVAQAVAFARDLPPGSRLHVHCAAGKSRSAALAAVILAETSPRLGDSAVAARIRAVRPSCAPNRVILALGDARMGRRLSRAFR